MTPESSRGGRKLGQFFTPRPVVDFALAALQVFGASIEGSRLIDPACGPGEWLAAGLAAGAGTVTGVDCDPAMPLAWREAGLTSEPNCLLMVADSLAPRILPPESFDLVVGNPPFGAALDRRSRREMREMARHYRLFRKPTGEPTPPEPAASDLRRLAGFPTELLFLERFVELTRDGGSIALILPEGVMANHRWRHARAWLLAEITLNAVVDLPRKTFSAHATSARTCLLLMHKSPAPTDHHVALAGIEDCARETLDNLLRACGNGSLITDAPPEGLIPPPLFRP